MVRQRRWGPLRPGRRTMAAIITTTAATIRTAIGSVPGILNKPCRAAAQSGLARRRRWSGILIERHPDPDRRAAVVPIFCPYLPVVRVDNGARDRQSHPHAVGLAGEKRFE